MAKPYIPYAGPVVTRDAAKAAGQPRFFTGKPCKRGHLSQRTTANGGCFACNCADALALYHSEGPEERAHRLANQKAWRDAHREQVRAEGRQYSREHREQGNAWKAANRAKLKAAEREARKRNPDAYKAIVIRYRETIKGIASVKATTHNRRARMRGVEGAYTAADVRLIGERQKWKCYWCSKPTKQKYHVDHIKPLSRGGSNWPSNIAIACADCNLSKNAADPIDFARRLGRLV